MLFLHVPAVDDAVCFQWEASSNDSLDTLMNVGPRTILLCPRSDAPAAQISNRVANVFQEIVSIILAVSQELLHPKGYPCDQECVPNCKTIEDLFWLFWCSTSSVYWSTVWRPFDNVSDTPYRHWLCSHLIVEQTLVSSESECFLWPGLCYLVSYKKVRSAVAAESEVQGEVWHCCRYLDDSSW